MIVNPVLTKRCSRCKEPMDLYSYEDEIKKIETLVCVCGNSKILKHTVKRSMGNGKD